MPGLRSCYVVRFRFFRFSLDCSVVAVAFRCILAGADNRNRPSTTSITFYLNHITFHSFFLSSLPSVSLHTRLPLLQRNIALFSCCCHWLKDLVRARQLFQKLCISDVYILLSSLFSGTSEVLSRWPTRLDPTWDYACPKSRRRLRRRMRLSFVALKRIR